MHQRPVLILLISLVVIGAGVCFFLIHSHQRAIGNRTATSTALGMHTGLFSDGQYGFTLQYPDKDALSYTFATYYHLPANWRVDALGNATGTPIVSIIATTTASDHSYPRYYDAELRIGASSDPKELARCTSASNTGAEQALPDRTIGSVVFKAFSFSTAGASQYLKGVSYRALHDGSCIAFEELSTGSSYHDDPASAADVPQATLDAAYASLDAIIGTVRFNAAQ